MTEACAAEDLRAMLERVGSTSTTLEDLRRYRTDPVAYARERLGLKVVLPHQACLAYAVAGQWQRITPEMAKLAEMKNPGHRRIAVTSGQKTGKTKILIVLALWFYECFDGARSMMTAAIGEQIRSVLWRELYSTLSTAPAKPPETPSEDPARGLVSADKSREIRGFTGRSIEAVAGISGNLLYLVDEASHLEQKKYEALDGNTAGEGDIGAPIVLTSQPTRNEGPFFDCFHSKVDLRTTMHFDSEVIADYQATHRVRVQGMATLEWCAAKKEEYGEDSVFYQMRVRGAFLHNEAGRIITMHLIEAARARWKLAPDDDGELAIGFDPAGPGDAGDEHGFAVVRGAKALELYTRRGLDEEKALEEAYSLLDRHRHGDEQVRIMLDAEGKLGASFYGRLRAESEVRRLKDPARAFHVYGVRTSSRHVRDKSKFMRVRDEVWWNLAQWMQTGAIPLDHKLEAELYAPMWIPMPEGQIRATPKLELRDLLGRSTDRADALALAVDPPRVYRGAEEDLHAVARAMTPAADANAWGYATPGDAGAGADANSWGFE